MFFVQTAGLRYIFLNLCGEFNRWLVSSETCKPLSWTTKIRSVTFPTCFLVESTTNQSPTLKGVDHTAKTLSYSRDNISSFPRSRMQQVFEWNSFAITLLTDIIHIYRIKKNTRDALNVHLREPGPALQASEVTAYPIYFDCKSTINFYFISDKRYEVQTRKIFNPFTYLKRSPCIQNLLKCHPV